MHVATGNRGYCGIWENSIDILSPFCYIKITYLGKFFNRSVI